MKYVDEFEQRIPRDEVEQLETIVFDEIKKIDQNIIAKTCGSYRRGAKSSGDIDILLTHPTYKPPKDSNPLLDQIVSALTKKKFLTDHISNGAVKYMGVCQLPSSISPNPHLHRRIDLCYISIEKYWCGNYFFLMIKKIIVVSFKFPTGLLYFTGSDYFNTQMRYS